MAAPAKNKPFDLKQGLLEAYAVNEQVNQYLPDHLDGGAWRAEPPGGKGRRIAAIFAHIHNARHLYLVRGGVSKIPPKINRYTVTRKQVAAALAKSARAISKMLAGGLDHPAGQVRNFFPGVAGRFAYMIAHEAHHHGQVCLLARQVGYPLPMEAGYGMWDWRKRWKQCGSLRPKRRSPRKFLGSPGAIPGLPHSKRRRRTPRPQRDDSVWRSVSRM